MKLFLLTLIFFFQRQLCPKDGAPRFILEKLAPNFELFTSDFVISELKNFLRKGIKRHKEFHKLENFWKVDTFWNDYHQDPETINKNENKIVDVKDRPVLRAALASTSIFLTEDKDFLRERNQIDVIEILNTEEFENKYKKLLEEDNQ